MSRKMSRPISFLFALVLLGSLPVAAKSHKTEGPKKGTLVIVGGGQVGPEIRSRFIQLAGGPDANFVIIPTADEDRNLTDLAKIKERFIQTWGVKNVTVLHTRDKKVADTKAFAEPIRHASAVWFPGGRQWRLADSYLGTRTDKEIHKLLDRGGVVGGSSAGATIQGSYLVRGAVEGNEVMMAPSHEVGLGLMKNVAIDQHIITRHREKDLDPVIVKHPELLGIGIDESTAIVVHQSQFEVIGKSKVAVHDGKPHDGGNFYFLEPGQKFNLATRSVIRSEAADK
jgi:cyanophycinase